MSEKMHLSLCLSILVACLLTGTAAAEDVRIGVINPIKVFEAAPQAAAARKKLESEFSSRDKQLVSKQKSTKEKEDRLIKDGAIMSEAERSNLEREIIAAKRDLKRDQDNFRDDLNFRRNEEFRKIQKLVVKAIEEVAKKENYDLIVGEGVIYASDRVDLTDKVIKRLK